MALVYSNLGVGQVGALKWRPEAGDALLQVPLHARAMVSLCIF